MLFRSSGDDDQKIDCEANKHNNQTESIQYQKWPHIETEQQTPASGATSKFAALKRKLFPSQNRRHPRQMSTLISPINAPVKLSLPHLGDNLDTQATTDLSLSEESLTPRHLEFKLPEYIAESDTFPENSDNNSEIAHKTSLLDDDDDRDLERAVEVLDFESSIADKTLQDMSNAIDDLRAWKEAHEQKTQDALDKLYDLQKAEKQLQYDEQPQDGFEYDHLVELTLQQQQQNREMQALELRKEAEAYQLECNLLHAKLGESEATRMEQTLRNSDSEGLALSRLRNDVFQLDVKQRQEALLHELQGADADLDMNIADVQAFTGELDAILAQFDDIASG